MWMCRAKHVCVCDVFTRKAVEQADVLLNQTHGIVRLDNIWGTGGGTRPVKVLIKKVKTSSFSAVCLLVCCPVFVCFFYSWNSNWLLIWSRKLHMGIKRYAGLDETGFMLRCTVSTIEKISHMFCFTCLTFQSFIPSHYLTREPFPLWLVLLRIVVIMILKAMCGSELLIFW